MDSADHCEVCFSSGRLSKLIEYHIDFDKTMKLCEYESCIFPLKKPHGEVASHINSECNPSEQSSSNNNLLDFNEDTPKRPENDASSATLDFDLEFFGLNQPVDTMDSWDNMNESTATKPLHNQFPQSGNGLFVDSSQTTVSQSNTKPSTHCGVDSDKTAKPSVFNSQQNELDFIDELLITHGDKSSEKTGTEIITNPASTSGTNFDAFEKNDFLSSNVDSSSNSENSTATTSKSNQDTTRGDFNYSSSNNSSSDISLGSAGQGRSQKFIGSTRPIKNTPCTRNDYMKIIADAISRTAKKKLEKNKPRVYEGLDLESLTQVPVKKTKNRSKPKRSYARKAKPKKSDVMSSRESIYNYYVS